MGSPLLPCPLHQPMFLAQGFQHRVQRQGDGLPSNHQLLDGSPTFDMTFLAKPFDTCTCLAHSVVAPSSQELNLCEALSDIQNMGGGVFRKVAESLQGIVTLEPFQQCDAASTAQEVGVQRHERELGYTYSPFVAAVSEQEQCPSPLTSWLTGAAILDPFHLINLPINPDSHVAARKEEGLTELRLSGFASTVPEEDGSANGRESDIWSDVPRSGSGTILTSEMSMSL